MSKVAYVATVACWGWQVEFCVQLIKTHASLKWYYDRWLLTAIDGKYQYRRLRYNAVQHDKLYETSNMCEYDWEHATIPEGPVNKVEVPIHKLLIIWKETIGYHIYYFNYIKCKYSITCSWWDTLNICIARYRPENIVVLFAHSEVFQWVHWYTASYFFIFSFLYSWWYKLRQLLGPCGEKIILIKVLLFVTWVISVFSFTKMHFEMSSGKRRPFCLGLNVWTEQHIMTKY